MTFTCASLPKACVRLWGCAPLEFAGLYMCPTRDTCLSQYTVYSIQYTVYSIQYTVYSIQYTVYSIQYTVYSIQYTVYSIQYTVYSIQYTVYSIQYTVHTFTLPLVILEVLSLIIYLAVRVYTDLSSYKGQK